ncbi:WD40-repeat-containing domain protein [Catenaria anguillulae PL171]|uniref:WD40-repeat-containing domain protein n=1 Tax=Catenaria anguillulae PL171 TaxID=765915 RepID=A0A1Y2HYG9_9FUNG|nr:WD40-repeat-containing domain protein [Catenaria anguillulae PL171]
MRLKIHNNPTQHSDAVACLTYSPATSDMYTLGDDQRFVRWSSDSPADPNGPPISTPLFPSSASASASQQQKIFYTSLHWSPTPKSDLVVAGSSDGKLILASRNATRIDKVLGDAHRGAILCVAWSLDAATLLSAGEDGLLKIWSKSGMLRSTLVTQPLPVFCAAWAAAGDAVLYTSGKSLCVKPLSAGSKPLVWRAHDGLVTKLAWNETTGLVVSGGEDKKYKVWDAFGRLLFSSQMLEHPVTSVAWTTAGDAFAVGTWNGVRVCDRLGWTLAAASIDCGSLLSLCWLPDGTSLAYSSARGHVGFAHLVDRRVEWRHIEVEVLDDKIVSVRDASSGHEEQLDFKDKLVHVGIAFGQVLLLTKAHAHVFAFGKSLCTFDLPGASTAASGGGSGFRIVCVRQSKSHFAVLDATGTISILTYSGRASASIKLASPNAAALVHDSVLALNDEVLAVRDPANECSVLLYDLTTGKPMTPGLTHSAPIKLVDVDHGTPGAGYAATHLVLVDKNNDLLLAPITPRLGALVKLAGMVESARFDEESPVLAAVVDHKLTFLMYPAVVLVDPDLRGLTRKVVKDAAVKAARIAWFSKSQCALRRTDGSSMVVAYTCPYTRHVHLLAARKKWDAMVTLGRAAKSREVWAVIAGLAVQGNELNTAEVAYAAVDMADKVSYLGYIKEISKSAEVRNAEVLVFKRMFREAEGVLVASGNGFWAVRMWCGLHQWDRALDVATRFKEYLPVVLAARQEFLARMGGLEEKNKRFVQALQQVDGGVINKERVRALVRQEETKVGLAR